MTIKVIATGSTREERADGNWGLSLLVGDDLLFDTYGVPAIFQRRLQEEGIDISAIRDIVVSHDHWDHTCGLWSIMLKTKGCRVHVCPHASGEPSRIQPGMFNPGGKGMSPDCKGSSGSYRGIALSRAR